MSEQHTTHPHSFVHDGLRKERCSICSHPKEHVNHRDDLGRIHVGKVEGLPDSGARTNYVTGAVREADPNKPAVEGISPFALTRLGMLMTRANVKYGDYRNWEKGMPVTRYIGGILRHTLAYLARDKSEDHLASVMWNAMCLMHHEEVGSTSGKTFDDLDDRPIWRKQ